MPANLSRLIRPRPERGPPGLRVAERGSRGLSGPRSAIKPAVLAAACWRKSAEQRARAVRAAAPGPPAAGSAVSSHRPPVLPRNKYPAP